ncbi:MAG: hypothetical protein R3Y09_03680 [Clostridia bacterium]
MSKIYKVLVDKKAEASPLIIAIVLCLILIMSAMSEVFRLTIITSGVRESLQSVVISVATSNYDELYNGLREGYSGGYVLSGNSWEEQLDFSDIYAILDENLGTVESGSYHVKEQDDGYEYRFSELEISVNNTSFAPRENDSNFSATVSLKLEIPLAFGWDMLAPLELNIETNAVYVPKF